MGTTVLTCHCRFQFRQDVTTNVMNLLQASWDDWSDPESGVTGYYVQFYQVVSTAIARYSALYTSAQQMQA